MGQQKNQGRNQNIPWIKWKWGHDDPNSVGRWESNPRRTLVALQVYFKNQEKAQINNLTSHVKELEKEQQIKPKVNRR